MAKKCKKGQIRAEKKRKTFAESDLTSDIAEVRLSFFIFPSLSIKNALCDVKMYPAQMRKRRKNENGNVSKKNQSVSPVKSP